MAKKKNVPIGFDDFRKVREQDMYYVDKTDFIREWWDRGDSVTLIICPRRFGKTLTMSMVEHFFSVKYADRGDLFEGLSIWQHEEYRKLQGTYPVISLSFLDVREASYELALKKIYQIIVELYEANSFLMEDGALSEWGKRNFAAITPDMDEVVATYALNHLSDYLYEYYGKRVILLVDQYDEMLQHAYLNGYGKKLASFMERMFLSAYKCNRSLERGLIMGLTRIDVEAAFSSLNHLNVITTTSDRYATAFGFTEDEVFAALDEYGLASEREKVKVKQWYGGFIFGKHRDIYNPWSILNFLDTGKYDLYWANTSSYSLAGKLLRESSDESKISLEGLMKGEHLQCPIDEQIVYNQLDNNEAAIWSLLLASGYLKVLGYEDVTKITCRWEPFYELALTNYEVERMFDSMVHGWFLPAEADYNDFVKALFAGDVAAMNEYMNRVALVTFSSFDTGKRASNYTEPERFYHGFVLGLLVDLSGQYVVQSNRESGFGRYDVMLEPKNPAENDAFILEFKVFNKRKENSLEDTVQAALKQIEDKKYDTYLLEKGIPAEHIHKYGFAFKGREVLIE